MMRIIKFFILFIFAINSYFMVAQAYIPMLHNSNEWRFTYCYQGSCADDTYFAIDDTLHNGMSYKILDGYHYISRTFWLREDSLDRKVYYSYEQSSGEGLERIELLLYDFSMQVGDSIDMKNPISPFLANAGYYILDSIVPRAMQDATMSRHFYLSPAVSNNLSINTAQWVEGVGSLSLINAPSGYPDVNDVGKLSCFFKNTQLYYANLDSTTSCSPVISTVVPQQKGPSVQVYPTYVDNFCHLQGLRDMQTLAVYHINGQLIYQQALHLQDAISLTLQGLSAGMYLLVFTDKQAVRHAYKIIKN